MPQDSPHSSIIEEGNWRPARPSVVLGVTIAIGAVAVLIGTSGLAGAAVAALAGLATGGFFLFTTASRYRILKRLCASILVFLCGALLLGCVALTFQTIRGDLRTMRGLAAVLRRSYIIGTPLLIGGVVIALGGAAVTSRDSIRPHHYRSAISLSILTTSLPLVAFAGLATIEAAELVFNVSESVATAGNILFGRNDSGPVDYIGIGVAWALALVSITFTRLGLQYLPIAEVAPSPQRKRLTAQLNRIQSTLLKLLYLLFILPLGVLLIEILQVNGALGLSDAYLRTLSIIATASSLRVVLLWGIVFGVGGIILGVATKRLARSNPRATVLRLIPFVMGLLLVVSAMQFSAEVMTVTITGPMAEYRSTINPLLRQYRPATLVVAMLVVMGSTTTGLYFGLFVVDFLLLPERAEGAALLSFGLFIAAVGSLLNGVYVLVGFIGIAGSLIAWDLNSNAVSLGRELGRHSPTRQSELVHASGSLLVATLGIVAAMAGLFLTGTISSPPSSIVPITAVISIFGLFALIFALRSR